MTNQVSEVDRTRLLDQLATTLGSIIEKPQTDLSVLVKLLSLPEDAWLAQNDSCFEAEKYANARAAFKIALAQKLEPSLKTILAKYENVPHVWNKDAMAERELRNVALAYLSYGAGIAPTSWQIFETTTLMTNEQACFETLVNIDDYRDRAIDVFYKKWKHDALVLNKWFSIQSTAFHPQTFSRVQALWTHEAFDPKNPNRVYSLLLRFGSNLSQFHQDQYRFKTYEWAAEKIAEIDQLNPMVAARVSGIFDFCKKTNPQNRTEAIRVIKNLLGRKLSANTFEILNNSYRNLIN